VFEGDYRKLFAMPELYGKVTQAQIQAVAKKLLRPSNRTVGTLVPAQEETADQQPDDRSPAMESHQAKEEK
jgi:predicted Zn-dependent peptidase